LRRSDDPIADAGSDSKLEAVDPGRRPAPGPGSPGPAGSAAVERLWAQMREANERLVLTTIDAQASTEAAETENRFKEEFLGTLSHELRTPLHAVFGWARMLEEHRLDAAQSERAVAAIGRNARAMARIVDELLDVARISTGKIHLAMEPLDVAAAIRASVDGVASTAAEKGVDLYFSSRLAGERLHADPGRLQQVLWNLLTNAIKFTPASGRVEVRLSRVNQHVEIRVSDTGRGITSDLLPHVFERFRQADRRMAGTSQGLGLGLAIAQHLVELHGGTLCAESAGEGRGATFTIMLPVLAVDAAGRPRAVDEASGTAHVRALAGVRVLLVEHDADARELASTILESAGATVTTDASARGALARLATTRADVLVTAMGLPDRDGCELLRAVRAREEGTGDRLPSVAITGYTRADDAQRMLDAGFDAHLLKPVDPADLTSAVIAALSSRPGIS
jgi:signal transduction histidine kinase/CheY-like chemotaxis protein